MNDFPMQPRFSIERARHAQELLAKKVVFQDELPSEIRFVGGVDTAYRGETAVGAVAVFGFDGLQLLEVQTSCWKIQIPYVPTLLGFRELPPSGIAFNKLARKPDVLLVDGHGLAHPCRCGFASHLGLVLDIPTIGVAKSRLVGMEMESGRGKTVLVDSGETIGAVIRATTDSKPLYVSIGHKVSLKTSLRIVERCLDQNHKPLPILRSHQIAHRVILGKNNSVDSESSVSS